MRLCGLPHRRKNLIFFSLSAHKPVVGYTFDAVRKENLLAQGREAIDAMLERILPAMRARGGYIPTCDHGVPEEVPYADYRYYRKRCVELG